MDKLRILCLHGYHGSSTTLRKQLAPISEGLGPLAEFFYVDAPYLALGGFGWWHAENNENVPDRDDPGVGPGTKHYKGLQGTRDWVSGYFNLYGPFDGVFGFSQGAALTGLLVGLRAPDGTVTATKPLTFDFAVMAGGFTALDSTLTKLYRENEHANLE